MTRTVVHSKAEWLPRSQTWIYPQVTRLGPGWRAAVVCNRVCNLSEFPLDDLAIWTDKASTPRALFDKVWAKLGLSRQYPLHGHLVVAHRPDLIHSHFGHWGWANLQTAKRAGAKHVVSFYGYDATRLPRKPRWQTRYDELFREVDRVLCEAPHMGDTIATLGCPREKIAIYHLGIDLTREGYRAPDWGPSRPLKILMAGRFVEKKGFPDALAALNKLAQARPDLDFQVSIIGDRDADPASGLVEQAMETEAAALGARVRFLGNLPYDVYRRTAAEHDLFLSPSKVASDGDSEGGAPVTILEMMATGLPIVSTRHCDIPYVLAEPNREILVEEGDVVGLTARLEALIDAPARWPVIAAANRARIEAEFDIAQQGPNLSRLYDELFDD